MHDIENERNLINAMKAGHAASLRRMNYNKKACYDLLKLLPVCDDNNVEEWKREKSQMLLL